MVAVSSSELERARGGKGRAYHAALRPYEAWSSNAWRTHTDNRAHTHTDTHTHVRTWGRKRVYGRP